MGTYIKKPVAIEAYRTSEPVDIETLEGTMHANAGDYIITGVKGERYPCKPDIFEATYMSRDDVNRIVDVVAIPIADDESARVGDGDMESTLKWSRGIVRKILRLARMEALDDYPGMP